MFNKTLFKNLQSKVQLHVAPAGVVRVLPDDELQRRLPLVQIVVLQQEDVLDVSLGDLKSGETMNCNFF